MINNRNVTYEIIRGFKEHIPIFIGLVYILGYVIDISYLDSIGFVSLDFININYLKSGILFLIFISPVIIGVFTHFDNPTDNLISSINQLPHIIDQLLSIILIESLILFYDQNAINDFIKTNNVLYFIGVILVIINFSIWFYTTSLLAKEYSKLKKNLLFLIPSIISFTYWFIIVNNTIKIVFGMLVGIMIYTHIMLGFIGDKKYNYSALIFNLIILLVVASTFGKMLYSNIPTFIGGNKQYQTTIIINDNGINYCKSLGLNVINNTLYDVNILYESSNNYYIKLDTLAISFNKSFISGVKSYKK